MKKQTKMIRQGNVLLLKVAAPANIQDGVKHKPNAHGKLVLAQGETSLHEHSIEETDAELIALGEKMLLHVTAAKATLRTTHIHTGQTLNRHTPQEIGGGYYRVIRQVELNPADIRKIKVVRD